MIRLLVAGFLHLEAIRNFLLELGLRGKNSTAVVVTFQCVSEASGRLVKERLSLTPRDSTSVGLGWGQRISAPVMLMLLVQTPHFEEE